MAMLYSSTGAELGPGINVPLAEIDATLRARGHVGGDFTHTAGDRAPQISPVTERPEYLLLQVSDSEPKTTLFPGTGFYHLHGLTVKDASLLLPAEDDPP